MGVFRKLSLLVWKNFALRRKHCVVTTLEIVMPTLIAVLFGLFLGGYGGDNLANESKESIRQSQPPPQSSDYNLHNEEDQNDPNVVSRKKRDLLVTETTTDTALDTTEGVSERHADFSRPDERDFQDYGSICQTGKKCIIAYFPISDLTKNVIQQLKSTIDSKGDIEWKGFNSESEIEQLLFKQQIEIFKPGRNNPDEYPYDPQRSRKRRSTDDNTPQITAAIVFETEKLKGLAFSYTIRTAGFNANEMKLFPDSNNDKPERYRDSGFLALQTLLDKVLIKHLTGSVPSHTVSFEQFGLGMKVASDTDNGGFDGSSFSCFIFTSFMVLGFIFMVPSVMRGVVNERETGIKEFMKLCGIPNWLHWTAWLINSMCLLAISITIVIFLLYVPIHENGGYIHHSNIILMWVILFLYLLSATTFCFFVSSFFRKPTIAITFGIILWVVSYFVPASLEFGKVLHDSLHLYCLALFPNMALHLAFKIMCTFERHDGVQWSNLNEKNPTNLLLGYVLLIMIFDSVLYLGLTLYVEAILPSDFGVRKPWYFIFMPSTYCEIKKRKYFSALPVANNDKDKTESKPESEVDGNQVLSQTKPEDSPAEVTDNKTEVNLETEQLPVTVTDSQKGVKTENNSKAQLEAATGEDKSAEKLTEAGPKEQLEESRPGFETEIQDRPIGVEIKNLRKVFGRNEVAVAGLSMKMYEGEIFTLLGHNGAGKTTTMSCCVGMMKPTSGTAIINGYDIRTDMDHVREHLGLCPQHNLLFDELTVDQHLKFFGRLKGISFDAAKREREQIIWKLQLIDKADTMSKDLSGGQKRKLSLGIALIGNSKVIFLDEPTSGMDIEARRAVWNVLLSERGHRTIILTTHFMEEADVLGDRIGIMAHGKLMCCGTPLFLKKFYGAGYTLGITTLDDNKKDDILAVVKTNVPDAYLETSSANIGEVFIILPMENLTTAVFPGMFKNLSNNKDRLGIQTVGLSLTTMDEVFVKAGKTVPEEKPKQIVETNPLYSDPPLETVNLVSPDEKKTVKDPEETVPTDIENREQIAAATDGLEHVENGQTAKNLISHTQRLNGFRIVFQQFWGLIIKRMKYTLRKWGVWLIQFVIPIALLAITITIVNIELKQIVPKNQAPVALKISLDAYKDPVTLFTSTVNDLVDSYEAVVGKSARKVTNLKQELEAIENSTDASKRNKYIVAAAIDDKNINAMYSKVPYHALPLTLNLAANTLLQKTPGASISVTNHPFNTEKGKLYNEFCDSQSVQKIGELTGVVYKIIGTIFGMLVPIGLSCFASSFIVAPIEEKMCKGKQLQLMTGVHPIVYWGSYFLWDFAMFVILIFLMMMTFLVFQNFHVYTANGAAGTILMIFLVYGFAAIPFSYIFSFFAKSVSGGFSLVAIIHATTGTIIPLICAFLEEIYPTFTNIVRYIFRFCPTLGLSSSIIRFIPIALPNAQKCSLLPDDAKDVLCSKDFDLDFSCRRCCSNCETFVGGNSNHKCMTFERYIVWSTEVSVNTRNGREIVTIPGIGQELFFLFLVGVLYHILLIAIEMGLFGLCRKKESQFSPANLHDEDVLNEATRVENLVMNGNLGADALVVANLSKSYGSFLAVSNLSFGVHHGECFGLLGVNGAGKTTTFRMLTGDEIRSYGNAYAGPTSLANERKKFYANVGYCPQFDGIIGVLTGREMVELFGRLRGLRSVHQESSSWLEKVGLTDSADVQCRKYSGGMKRRLSAAMAMVGDPEIVFLDEPTTGVDPISRREFWKIIVSIRESGRAVILTSHSMDEISACCSRLGIMVNGQFQCFGSVQHLKSKFAQGYCLSIKLKSTFEQDSEAHDELLVLDQEILASFSPCTLKDNNKTTLQYTIQDASLEWDVLFQKMEDVKTNHESLIEEYSIAETTLEEVFLTFARLQHPGRAPNVS